LQYEIAVDKWQSLLHTNLLKIIRPHRTHALHKMRAIATDKLALAAFMSPAKTARPIEMPFRGLIHMGPRKHVLDGVKVGRIHTPSRGVTRWRCGRSSTFFDHVLSL